MTGKLCEVPVHPLSRSEPLPSSGCARSSVGTVSVRDFWPAAQPVGGGGAQLAPEHGRQRTRSTSLNRGVPFMSSLTGREFLNTVPCFFDRSGMVAVPAVPQFGLPKTGGTKFASFLVTGAPTFNFVSGCGVQLPAGVSTHALMATVQTWFATPSVSHVGSPSWQSRCEPDTTAVPVSQNASQDACWPVTRAAAAAVVSPSNSRIVNRLGFIGVSLAALRTTGVKCTLNCSCPEHAH